MKEGESTEGEDRRKGEEEKEEEEQEVLVVVLFEDLSCKSCIIY